MAQSNNPELKQIDRRVAERYVRRGILADKDYQAHLASLPDLEGQYEVVNTELEARAEDVDDEADESDDEAQG